MSFNLKVATFKLLTAVMATRATRTVPCSYLKRDGSICSRSSFGGTCFQHVGRTILFPCRLCGKGTRSATSICTTPGPCKIAQHTAMEAAKRAAKREPTPITSEDLDALVDELINSSASILKSSVADSTPIIESLKIIATGEIIPKGIIDRKDSIITRDDTTRFAAEVLCDAASVVNQFELDSRKKLVQMVLKIGHLVDIVGSYISIKPPLEPIKALFGQHHKTGYARFIKRKGEMISLCATQKTYPEVGCKLVFGITITDVQAAGSGKSLEHTILIAGYISVSDFWNWLINNSDLISYIDCYSGSDGSKESLKKLSPLQSVSSSMRDRFDDALFTI